MRLKGERGEKTEGGVSMANDCRPLPGRSSTRTHLLNLKRSKIMRSECGKFSTRLYLKARFVRAVLRRNSTRRSLFKKGNMEIVAVDLLLVSTGCEKKTILTRARIRYLMKILFLRFFTDHT
jgi:hypothetical protein